MRPFELRKIGHVVLNVTDLEAAVHFYTEVLGLKVSDRYPETMVPGGMVFMRVNTDHHGVALVGGAGNGDVSTLNHFAFEVGTLEEVFRARTWLREHGVKIHFEGRRRAGCQIAVEFTDPDGNNLEVYWNIDQIGTTGDVRPASEWRQALTLEDAVANPVKSQAVMLAPAAAPTIGAEVVVTEIEVQRRWLSATSTIGSLTVNGKPECFTLEDVVRTGPKVPGQTAIPAGRYEVQVTVSERCKAGSLWTPDPEFRLPLLVGVPNFEGVRIHAGNQAKDTEGCLLVGQDHETDALSRSRAALAALLPKITQGLARGKVWLTVKDLPPTVIA